MAGMARGGKVGMITMDEPIIWRQRMFRILPEKETTVTVTAR